MNPAPFFFVAGASHHTAPLEVREQLTVIPDRLDGLRVLLGGIAGLDEHLVLATCNRTEFYGIAASAAVPGLVEEAFCRFQPFDPAAYAAVSYRLAGIEAVRHLFGVAAGLDSKMIGETEILGQVKEAYREAVAGGGVGPRLHRIFQKSFHAAKWARTHTGIGAGHVGIGNVAAGLARRVFGNLAACRILVAGAGEVGLQVLKALAGHGARDIVLTSRDTDKARRLAEAHRARAVEFARFAGELPAIDIAILSTAAPRAILSREQVAAAIHRRPNRPLLILDLAVPRDVEAGVERLDNVFLYNFDDLAVITNEAREARRAEMEKCREGLAARAGELGSFLADVPTPGALAAPSRSA